MFKRSDQLEFNLQTVLDGLVSVRARIPADALTAEVLGTERAGHGAVIRDDGLILTIGYLIAEAHSVWIATTGGATVPGYVLGYDYDTGFGLVKPTIPISRPPLRLGVSASLDVDEPVIVAGFGDSDQVIMAQVIAKREFAGYWEYVLDEAIFTAPAHPNWGGTALIGMDGLLYGVGSLLIQDKQESDEPRLANMFVPIDLLKPIMDDLCTYGAQRRPARPWLGFLVQDVADQLVISGVYTNCPAHRAGLEPGDVILGVGGAPVSDLAGLFRRIWRLGDAGVEIPLTVVRDAKRREMIVKSADRGACMKSGMLH
jgi:S1-C subfamily serine protease